MSTNYMSDSRILYHLVDKSPIFQLQSSVCLACRPVVGEGNSCAHCVGAFNKNFLYAWSASQKFNHRTALLKFESC